MSTHTSRLGTGFAELGLAEPEVCAPHLRAVMERVGFDGTPSDFLRSISHAFRYGHQTLGVLDVNFRAQPSHEVFKEALKEASQRLRGPARILVVGCGEDYSGCNARYAKDVVEEIIPKEMIGALETWDLARGHMDDSHRLPRAPFQLVVTSSVLHFVAEVGPALRDILDSIPDKGVYLMAHEPSSRFWRNRQLLDESRAMSRDTTTSRLGMFVSLAAYRRKLKTLLSRQPKVSLYTLVNQYLAERHGFKSELAMHEIVRIADPHRPREFADSFRIGLNGFDSQNLRELAPDIHGPLWSKTYDHLGYVAYDELPRRWQQRERDLRQLHPTDGCVWTALWAVSKPA